MECSRFSNHVALVVGAGAGMGEATTLQLLKEGAKVVALDLFDDRLQRLKELAGELSANLDLYAGDVADDKVVDGVVQLISEKYGTLDHLAHCAGIMDGMYAPDTLPEEVYDRVMNVNVRAVWRMVRAAMPLMKDHENGASIVIVTSLGGYVGSSSGMAYITSKHAAEGLMKNLAFYYKANNVRVNSVAPGAIETEIMDSFARIFPDLDLPFGMDMAGMQVYMQKGVLTLNQNEPMGTAQDIADAITFLCSDQAKYINGSSLIVDGGWYSA